MCVCVLTHYTETHSQGAKLSKEDLQITADLWDNVINPACIKFEKETGKPAEALREAIAGVSARHVSQDSSWNMWQKVWWRKEPKVKDTALRSKSVS